MEAGWALLTITILPPISACFSTGISYISFRITTPLLNVSSIFPAKAFTISRLLFLIAFYAFDKEIA
jgi:hypothetical protein